MIRFIARTIQRLVALAALLAMLVGAPWLLWKLGAPLLPDHVPNLAEIWNALTERDTGQIFLGTLAVIGFAAWIVFATSILAEAAAAITRRPAIRLPGLRMPQTIAAGLIGLIIATGATANAAPAHAMAGMPTLPHNPTVAAALRSPTAGATTPPRHAATTRPATFTATTGFSTAGHADKSDSHLGSTWTVHKGDTLWSIADKALGDPLRYPDIAALNKGRVQADGHMFVADNFLLPGWTLLLPPDAHLPDSAASPHRSDAGGTAPVSVVVQLGDTLSQIALDTMGDANQYPALAAANGIANPDLIYPGQTIRIPAPRAPGNRATADPKQNASAIAQDDGSVPSVPGVDGSTTEAKRPADVRGHAEGDSGASSGSPGTNEAIEVAPSKPATADANENTDVDPASIPEATADIPPTRDTNGGGKLAESAPATQTVRSATDTAPVHAPALSQRTVALGGITGLAAALAWAGLLTARRKLSKARRPGQRLAPATVEEARIERAIRERSRDASPARLNAALRSVNGLLAEHAPAGVDLVLISDDAIELRPTIPAPPPAPFTGTESSWVVDLPDVPDSADDEILSALPALVTLGTLDDGRLVAVDVEHIGALSLTGDPDRCRCLVNHIVLELLQSPWTDGVHLALHRVAEDACGLDSDRIQPVENLETATQFISYQVEHTRELLGDEPIAHARTDTAYSDAWEPHILIADSNDLAQISGIGELIETLEQGPAAAAAIITSGDSVNVKSTVILDGDGSLHLPQPAGSFTMTAASLADAEFAAIIALFNQTNIDGAPSNTKPIDTPAAGSRTEQAEAPVGAAHPKTAPDDSMPDGRAAAPETAGADPTLDADIAEWFADHPSRPRIAILGDAHVDGLGVLRDRPLARMTEYAVYFALHPAGVTIDKFVTDLWPENRQPSDSTRRADLSRLRAWLGERSPNDPFLPTASGRYRLADRLLDAELFARLRARAMSHAKRGDARSAIVDYQAALRLVRGPVLPEAAGAGYTWLTNPDRMEDRILPMQIIDTAHALVDIALTIGAVSDAESATTTGRIADPYSNVPLCDLVRIALAREDRETAKKWADLMLTLNDVDLPADLPEPCGDLVAALYRATVHSSSAPMRASPARAAP